MRIAAPGVSVTVAMKGRRPGKIDGTSFGKPDIFLAKATQNLCYALQNASEPMKIAGSPGVRAVADFLGFEV